MLVVDAREPKKIQEAFMNKYNDCRVAQLLYGDFEINQHIIVERKTPSDFVSSIRDGRIFKQAEGMKSNYDVSIVMITGSITNLFSDYVMRGVNRNAIMGTITHLERMGVSVVFVDKLMDWFIDMLISQEEKPTKHYTKKVQKVSSDDRINFLVGLPNIGQGRAKDIIHEYETVENALAHVDDWVNIKGISKKTVAKVKHLLHHRG